LAYAINVGKSNLYPLLRWNIDSRYTRQNNYSFIN
jgi:hypothetical protein